MKYQIFFLSVLRLGQSSSKRKQEKFEHVPNRNGLTFTAEQNFIGTKQKHMATLSLCS